MSVCAVLQAEASLLQARLPYLRFASDDKSAYKRLQVTCLGATPAALQLQSPALQALKFASAKDESEALTKLPRCTLTRDMIAALSSLPEWGGCLDFQACKWLKKADSKIYTQLAQHVPLSFSKWGMYGVSEDCLRHVCVGIKKRRKGLGLPPVQVFTECWNCQSYTAAANEHAVVARWY